MSIKHLSIPLFIFLFLFISSVNAYESFSKNPNLNVTSYFFVQDLGYNTTDQQCMNVTNDGSSLNFTNLYCPSGTLSGYLFSLQPLTTNEFTQSENQTLGLEYWYNASKSLFIPKYKEVIIFLNYSISNNTSINPTLSKLTYYFSGTSSGNYPINTSTGLNQGTFILNYSAIDRNLSLSLDLIFGSTMATNMNIKINKFKIYTIDTYESYEWSSNSTNNFIYFCGSDYSEFTGSAGFVEGNPNYNLIDDNRSLLNCKVDNMFFGCFNLGGSTKCRRYISQEMKTSYAGCYNLQESNYSLRIARDFYYLWLPRQDAACAAGWFVNNVFLIESDNLLEVKITKMINMTVGADTNYLNEQYSGTPTTSTIWLNISGSGLLLEPTSSLVRILLNKSDYTDSATPSGLQWRFCTNSACGTNRTVSSSWHDFYEFSSESCSVYGWSCSDDTNREKFIDENCEITEDNYCGACGCNDDYTRCNFPTYSGTWCDDYNLTRPCCTQSLLDAGWFGVCRYPPNCYDIYTENPNPYNSSKNKFTTLYANCLGNKHNQCAINYMCVQFMNPSTKQFEGKVSCYNGQNGSAYYYDENGDLFNGTDYIENLTNCTLPTQYTNSWTCINANCNWCNNVCQINECSPAPAPPSVLGNPMSFIALTIGGLFGITDLGISQNISSLIFSLIFSLLIGVMMAHFGRIKGNGLVSIFFVTNISMLILFTIISWFNPIIMVILLIISGFIMVKSLGVFGG